VCPLALYNEHITGVPDFEYSFLDGGAMSEELHHMIAAKYPTFENKTG
jgi:hypothetical protein